MSYSDRIVSQRLAFTRIERNITQEQAAKELCITRSAISKVENRKAKPQTDIIYKCAELYGTTCDYLMGKDEAESHDAQFVCDYTGLSPEAVEVLHKHKSEQFREYISKYISVIFNSRTPYIFKNYLKSAEEMAFYNQLIERIEEIDDGTEQYKIMQEYEPANGLIEAGRECDAAKYCLMKDYQKVLNRFEKEYEKKTNIDEPESVSSKKSAEEERKERIREFIREYSAGDDEKRDVLEALEEQFL